MRRLVIATALVFVLTAPAAEARKPCPADGLASTRYATVYRVDGADGAAKLYGCDLATGTRTYLAHRSFVLTPAPGAVSSRRFEQITANGRFTAFFDDIYRGDEITVRVRIFRIAGPRPGLVSTFTLPPSKDFPVDIDLARTGKAGYWINKDGGGSQIWSGGVKLDECADERPTSMGLRESRRVIYECDGEMRSAALR